MDQNFKHKFEVSVAKFRMHKSIGGGTVEHIGTDTRFEEEAGMEYLGIDAGLWLGKDKFVLQLKMKLQGGNMKKASAQRQYFAYNHEC